jgi:hypothetical protein
VTTWDYADAYTTKDECWKIAQTLQPGTNSVQETTTAGGGAMGGGFHGAPSVLDFRPWFLTGFYWGRDEAGWLIVVGAPWR